MSESPAALAKTARNKARGRKAAIKGETAGRLAWRADMLITHVLERGHGAEDSYLRSATAVETGLHIAAVDYLVEMIAPGDSLFIYSIVPSATLARRRQQAKKNPEQAVLSTEESATVVRLARLFDRARSVWKSEDGARRFLNTPHMLLDGRTPMDVALKTDEGARVVEEVLGKLEYGTAL